MIYAIILAGGSGTRFWPLSRESEPKQFLNICSDKPMIEETLCHISSFVKNQNIYLAVNKSHQKRLKRYLTKFNIPKKNVLIEPSSKNTLAPIGLLSERIYREDKEAVIIVLPSDHYIKDNARFLKTLNRAIDVAKKGYIVTLGIKPDHPETGFGYIKINANRGACGAMRYFKVDRFIEKPNFINAKRFFKDKRYFWNAGIFIFRADIMLDEISKLMPKDYAVIVNIGSGKKFFRQWARLSSISIDYALMEKTDKTALVPANFGWNDMGSWKAIELISAKDKSGNIFKGKSYDIGSLNTLVWAGDRLVVTLGLKNIIIVDTKDALLVCSKDKTQEVRTIVQYLKKQKKIKGLI